MSQRNSEYARVPGDTYVTPKWVYWALHAAEPWAYEAWDCAPIDGLGDFLNVSNPCPFDIATNPPFKLADEFISKALIITCFTKRKVAMLLPHAFDTAKGRINFWGKPFKAKYTLTRRIRWENLEQKKNGPSTNHAWYVWDWSYRGKPFMGWLP